MSDKKRLDQLLVDKGLTDSRTRAKALIMAGKVFVHSTCVDKPGIEIQTNAPISIRGEDFPFVSRGGLKLEAAIKAMKICVQGLVCLDVGASTGGFTDCLLQHGAKHVFAVDVGYGQLAWKLRNDPRVTPIERTNIRHMENDRLPVPVDLATIDTSFISLNIVVPETLRFLKPKGSIIALIKPQFEVGRGRLGKGGVVKDTILHNEVIRSLSSFFNELGLHCGPVVPSPILGPKGNQEFLILLSQNVTRSIEKRVINQGLT